MDTTGIPTLSIRRDDVSCVCGQELDVCHHAYCPRCGSRVAGHSIHTVRFAAAC